MVRDSAMVTMESYYETIIVLSNGTISHPYNLPFPENGVQNAPQDQLCDACCHLVNVIEDIDKISFA